MRLKKIGRDVRRHAAMGYTVIALDEASHIIGWNTWNGWYPVGRPVRTPVSLSRKRFHSFGELHWEVYRLYGNTEEINESIRACWITVRSDPSR